MGITITSVKIVVDKCSKCREYRDEIPRDNDGRAYEDKEVSCINCSLNQKTNNQTINSKERTDE